MSDTPRTDALYFQLLSKGFPTTAAMYEHACQLERELSSMTERYETSHRSRMHADQAVERLERELNAAPQAGAGPYSSATPAVHPEKPAVAAPCNGYQMGRDSDLCVHCGRMWSDHHQ